MSSVLFFTFLLFQFELPLFFRFSSLAGRSFALRLVFFILLLQRLLRLRADARGFHLFSSVSLTAFGIVRFLLLLRLDRYGELQSAVVCQNELPDLSVGRLRTESGLADGQFSVVDPFEYACPERLIIVYRQL